MTTLTAIELHAVRDALRRRLAELDRIEAVCAHCQHFPRGRCEKHDAVPPAEFQRQQGVCPDWQFDGVPF